MGAIRRARQILYVRTDRLGETLLNLPAVAALKRALPDASLSLLVREEFRPLLSHVPCIDHVIPAPQPGPQPWWARALRLSRLLRPCRFDLAIISNPQKELHVAVWLAGIPVRVGYDRKWGWLLTHRLQDRKALGDRHEVEYNLDLVRALGVPASIPQRFVPRVEREENEMLQLLAQQGIQSSEPFIAVHPWTSNPIKQWPTARFAALIEEIVKRLAVHVVVIGGEEECPRAHAALPHGVSVVNLVGRLTLTQLAAVLARARVLVSNDSGPMHLAAAVGTPTVALFGTPDPATSPGRWGPWGEGHCVIWKPSMEAITVEEVFDALQQRLARS